MLLQLGRLEQALTIAEEVRAALPDNADAAYLSGAVRIGLRRLDQAEADLRQALALSNEHTAAMSDLAVLLIARQRPAEARRLLVQLLELQPGNAHARGLLADLP